MAKTVFLFLTAAFFCAVISFFAVNLVSDFRAGLRDRFAEQHAFLSDDDENQPFADDALDEQTLARRDSDLTLVSTGAGVLSWPLLAKATLAPVKGDPAHALLPVYTPAIAALDATNREATGYMFPLEASQAQSHFLLTPYPPSCPYCLPAGASELIEVTTTAPVTFSYEPVTVKGSFALLKTSTEIKDGLFYQLKDASLVSP